MRFRAPTIHPALTCIHTGAGVSRAGYPDAHRSSRGEVKSFTHSNSGKHSLGQPHAQILLDDRKSQR